MTAALLTVGFVAGYLSILASESEGELGSPRVLFVALSLLGAAWALLIGSMELGPQARTALACGGALALLLWTVGRVRSDHRRSGARPGLLRSSPPV